MADEIGQARGAAALADGLASGLTLGEAATRAGISRRTAQRRQQAPGFRELVQALRGERLDRCAGLLADGTAEAVQTLRGLLQAESEAVRLGAARNLLEQAVRVREATELEARLAALEEQAAASAAAGPRRFGA